MWYRKRDTERERPEGNAQETPFWAFEKNNK